MKVLELWRYPVKSLQGERLAEAQVGEFGIEGDRRWALFDVATGLGLTARRVPELLFAAGRVRTDGGPEVVLPDGSRTSDAAVLSAWLGRPVELRPAGTARPQYESPDDDFDDRPSSRWHDWAGAAGAFHDNAEGRLSLVTTGSLGTWDRRRFRANVLLDGAGEDDLVGRRVRLGGVLLDVRTRIPRCVMVTRPQPGGIGRDTGVLKTIHRERGGDLAVAGTIARPGTVRAGDPVQGEAGAE